MKGLYLEMSEMKNILITGCSSGIGHNAAIELHNRGWKVIATCRTKKDCEIFEKMGIITTIFDYNIVQDLTKLLSFLKKNNIEHLDALFNNGAYAIPGALEDLPREAFREIFETNVIGYIDLINKTLPLLKRSKSCRVINCSSVLGFVALPYRGAYNATKFAIEGITDTLRRENIHSNIRFILIQPGPIMTDIRKKSIKHFEKWINVEKSYHKEIYKNKLIPYLYSKSNKKDFFELYPGEVTKKLIIALETKNPKDRYKVTIPTKLAKLITILPTSFQDVLFRNY